MRELETVLWRITSGRLVLWVQPPSAFIHGDQTEESSSDVAELGQKCEFQASKHLGTKVTLPGSVHAVEIPRGDS